MESMAAADQREGEGMTYGYDLECLVIALDNIENAARRIVVAHKVEDWLAHRLAHIRGEATSLKKEIEKHRKAQQ